MSDTTGTQAVDTALVNTVMCIGILVVLVLSIIFTASVRTLEIREYARRHGRYPTHEHMHLFNKEPLL